MPLGASLKVLSDAAEPAPRPRPSVYPHPTSAVMRLTGACNLRCTYCFEMEHPVRHMSEETALQAVRWLLSGDRERVSITLFGGEPLLRKKMIPWLLETARSEAEAAGKTMGFSITTNGTLFDAATAQALREAGVKIQLSADGGAEGHDTHRQFIDGRGSFALVEEAVPRIREACPDASVRMTITPDNVFDMANGVSYFADAGFDTINPVPVYEADWSPEAVAAYAEQLDRVAALWLRCLLGGRMLSIYGITDTLRRSFAQPRKYGCGAGRGLVAIDVDGSIFPCHRFVGYTAADTQWKLGDVWRGFDDERRGYFHDLTTGKMEGCATSKATGSIACRTCDFFSHCGGGCMAVNFHTSGDPARPPATSYTLKKVSVEAVHAVVGYLEAHRPALWTRLAAGYMGVRAGGAPAAAG